MRALAIVAVVAGLVVPLHAGAEGRINLDVQDADISSALRIIAQKSGLNFVVDEEVRGKVTLRLRNVAWQEALKIVLRSKSLGMEQSDNIVRIAPLAKLAEERDQVVRLAKAREASAPRRTRIIPVSNAKAADLVPAVKATLSEHGTVIVDERTNSLIVTDIVR